jgi:hypothetical protein
VNDVSHRRRESDKAEQRAGRALELGDHTGHLIATAQAAAARRRRAEWELAMASTVIPFDAWSPSDGRRN